MFPTVDRMSSLTDPSSANGTLRFTDADGDGVLSAGDFFTLSGSSTASYRLEVDVLFQEWTSPVDV